MINILEISDPDLKTKITKAIMLSLPKWFNPPEDIINKSIIHREYPFIVIYDDSTPIGFAALKIHNQFTADIYNIGIKEEYHRKGIGHQLMTSIYDYCIENNFQYLTVKTLDGSVDYEPYKKTRSFYMKEGFIPLEVFKTFWNEENPCLFLVKKIENNDRD